MTIVDRPLKCETCFFRYDDLNRLRLHKRQHEGVCESYDLSNEEQYYRTQQFVYKTNKKVRLKVMSSVLTCSHCEAKFDLEQDAAAPFKLVQHVAHHHPSHFITFRFVYYVSSTHQQLIKYYALLVTAVPVFCLLLLFR